MGAKRKIKILDKSEPQKLHKLVLRDLLLKPKIEEMQFGKVSFMNKIRFVLGKPMKNMNIQLFMKELIVYSNDENVKME